MFVFGLDREYSSRIPVIIGKNIIEPQECQQNFGLQFLQKAILFTLWYLSFRCLVVREKELKRNKNKIAKVRSAEAGQAEMISIEGS